MKNVKLVVLKNFEFENQPSKLLISFWLSAVSASQDTDVMKNIDYFSLKMRLKVKGGWLTRT